MDTKLKAKYERLMTRLKGYDAVGIACSGGVDSTLLAYCCCSILGPENVVILFGDSTLLAADLRTGIEERLRRELGQEIQLEKIEIDPLVHSDFVKNRNDRCYVCKKNIYRHFLDHLEKRGISVLFDGTNCDDLQEDRPGLVALKELNIETPLVDAGFSKADIRSAAADLGLGNADLPSSSCLATRIEKETSISVERLREVERLESFLLNRGYQGCRVRPRTGFIIIEILAEDFARIADAPERESIVSYFQQNGYNTVLLELGGRRR